GSRSLSVTRPLKRADTGPTFILATARKPLSSVFSSSSHPGMQALSTSGSFNLVHTTSRGAASWTSPFIVMAMGRLRGRVFSFSQVKHAGPKRKGDIGHEQCIFAAQRTCRRFGTRALGLAGAKDDD